MEQWPLLSLVVLVASHGAFSKQAPASATGGSGSSLSQFWTDDYKVFDQIYGKTSDKELYSKTLPPSITYGLDATNLQKQASEKKERFAEKLPVGDQLDPYGFAGQYAALLTNPSKKENNKKPQKYGTKFIPSNFKPIISKETDPETYNYLKHLELLSKQKDQFSQINIGGFKPYLHPGANNDETEGFKSIQDILEAHEANKGRAAENESTDDQVKYLTYGKGNPSKPRSQSKKVRPPTNKGKPCPSGRCRKRATTTYRGRTYLTRPYVRKIKKIIRYQ